MLQNVHQYINSINMQSVFSTTTDPYLSEILKDSKAEQWLLKRYSGLNYQANICLCLSGVFCFCCSWYQFLSATSLCCFDLFLVLTAVFIAPFLILHLVKGKIQSPYLPLILALFFSISFQERLKLYAPNEQVQ